MAGYSKGSLRGATLAIFVACYALFYALRPMALNYTATARNPGIAAFVGVCFLNMFAISVIGVRAWPQVPSSDNNGESLYKIIPEAQVLAVIQAAFQGWDFCMCFQLPELQDPLMVVHHALVTVVSVASFELGVMHEPALFFLGLSEIQGMPLTFIDFFSHIPPSSFPDADLANLMFDVAKYSFAALFFYARIFLWIRHTRSFVTNARHAWLQPGRAGGKKKQYKGAILFFAGACVLLTALQVYWGFMIVYEVYKLFA